MDTAFVVCKLTGNPDLPPFEAMDGGVGLYVRDEKGNIIDGCGYCAVGPVGDNTVAIYRVTTSAETIAAIEADPKRWAVLDAEKPLPAKAVTDMKALLATDPKLKAVIDKETWTAITAHARTLAALGVTAEQFDQAKPTAILAPAEVAEPSEELRAMVRERFNDDPYVNAIIDELGGQWPEPKIIDVEPVEEKIE